jgi:hypothetical protein
MNPKPFSVLPPSVEPVNVTCHVPGDFGSAATFIASDHIHQSFDFGKKDFTAVGITIK